LVDGIELSWSAKQYIAFEDERTRPVRDLLAALPPIDARSVIDLGCGPGNSTEVLAARYPEARVAGMDSSPDMIAAARRRLPQATFSVEDVQDCKLGKLAPAGGLAVQMPDNLDGPAHRLMRKIAAEGPWAAKLADAAAARTPLAGIDWYHELLRPLCAKLDFWRTTYYHSLSGGAAAIVEWFKGSGLRPFIEPLSDAERGAYLERYTAAIADAYPPLAGGSVLLPFPRVFMLAIR